MMAYYKIISDGIIVDAVENPTYVRYQEKNRIWLTCTEQLAQGLVASDGSEIYLIAGKIEMDGYRTVTMEEIADMLRKEF